MGTTNNISNNVILLLIFMSIVLVVGVIVFEIMLIEIVNHQSEDMFSMVFYFLLESFRFVCEKIPSVVISEQRLHL